MNDSSHLDHKALARAAVDESDLPAAEQRHLAACTHCQEQVQKLLAELEGLGGLARELAPSPPRSFRLPAGEKTTSRAWVWQGALVGGLAVAALLLISLWLGPAGAPPQPTTLARSQAQVWGETTDEVDQALVSIMDVSEEDPYSPFQRFVLGGEDTSWDEQFIDFVSPFDQEDYSRLEKGRARC